MKNCYIFLIALFTSICVNATSYLIVNKKEDTPPISEQVYEFKYIDYVSLKKNDAESIIEIINAEGFHNAFNHYSTYRDINDMKFHELKNAYMNASKNLFDYINAAAGINSEDDMGDK